MKDLDFEWDEAKNLANIQKHGISFREAMSVFADDHALLIADPDHSDDEDRFLLLGLGGKLRLLLVCHCIEVDQRLIRIISCRKASRKEMTKYRR
jgi:uncharacterized DUF497 family protein